MAVAGIQYNFEFECRLGHIFICWCSFACNILSQNQLNSVPEHRVEVVALKKARSHSSKTEPNIPYPKWRYDLRKWLTTFAAMKACLLMARP